MNYTQEEQAEILIETFEMCDSWPDRYRTLIEMGYDMADMDDALKTEEHRVKGCMSQVWLVVTADERADGTPILDFVADSDAAIVKGLTAILHTVYGGQSAEDILAFDIIELLGKLELSQHLSMNRRNGLNGMVKRIKTMAAAVAPEALLQNLPPQS